MPETTNYPPRLQAYLQTPEGQAQERRLLATPSDEFLTSQQRRFYELEAMDAAGCSMRCAVRIVTQPDRTGAGVFAMTVMHATDDGRREAQLGAFGRCSAGIDADLIGRIREGMQGLMAMGEVQHA